VGAISSIATNPQLRCLHEFARMKDKSTQAKAIGLNYKGA